jgi:AcrR family transcriptional regulator
LTGSLFVAPQRSLIRSSGSESVAASKKPKIRPVKIRSNKQPQRRPQELRRAEMQRRLLDATIFLLIDRGYSDFRTADVAAKAKVSRGAMLHHYRTKDALIVAALEDLYHTTTAVSDRRLARAGSKVTLRDVLEDSEAYYYSDEFIAMIDLVMSAGRNPSLSKKIKRITYDYRQPLEERWTRSLSEQGLPYDAARDAVWLIQAVIRGLRIRKLVDFDPHQIKRVSDLTLRLLEAFAAERKHVPGS